MQIFDGPIQADAGAHAPLLADMSDLIVPRSGYWPYAPLDLIPSRLELSRTLKNPAGKERRLAEALAQVHDRYEVVIIDCAPTESILTDAAYFASRFVVAPVKPEFMAAVGLPLLARSLQEFRLENAGHVIELAGLVFNHSSQYSAGPEGRQSMREMRRRRAARTGPSSRPSSATRHAIHARQERACRSPRQATRAARSPMSSGTSPARFSSASDW